MRRAKHFSRGKRALPPRYNTAEWIQRWWRPAVSWLLFALGPFFSLLMVEILNEKNPFQNLNATEWIMNLALYVVYWALLWLLLGRRRRAAATGAALFFLMGLVNHYVLEFKGHVLFPNDIAGWRTAANVAGTYDFTPDRYIWGAFALLVVYLLLLRFLALPQHQRANFSLRWVNWLTAALSAAYLFAFFLSPWLPAAGIKTQQWKTQSNGWLLNFSIALRYSRVDRPDGYSLGDVYTLTQALSDRESAITLLDDPVLGTDFDPASIDESPAPNPPSNSLLTVSNDPDGTQPVNILCIMDESFADLSIFDRLTTGADALPFTHSLSQNTIKGWMYSPVTGGGTASVEYEFLTGNSISFLPLGTVAYQLYVRDRMPSLISWANALGFETTTFHPYEASGWNRREVYHFFGADHQLYNTDVENPEYVRGYISDECAFNVMEEITDAQQDDRQFIFTVTMQNHGGYKQGWYRLPRSIALTGNLTGVSEYTEQYLALMNETDRALSELLAHYSQSDEPTLIVFFGDHQGNLSDWFYERLYGKPLDERTIREVEQQYAVPFFIWANYPIREAQDVIISPNYLGALLGQVSNYPTTNYMDYLCGLYETLPVINRVGYITADGQTEEEADQLPTETQHLLDEYAILSYYNLFQREDEIDQRFFLP